VRFCGDQDSLKMSKIETNNIGSNTNNPALCLT
jgi:hypothetical protein